MNFYHAYYKRQIYDEDKKIWRDTFYICQGIIVIADCYETARQKIELCLSKVETGNYRGVLTSDIEECLGIDLRHCFDGEFEVDPII